ncbi:hypothetical protein [Spirulina subsalsa]|uniref:hypothetical protein n=1 Tax=Spirulina subsalsa TaxID=54311 RepID=UPI0002F90A2E|nr:hypothetical protein [Spirulina subsalsa]
MLVILTDDQILSPQNICSGCLLANRQGLPRWRNGKLGCCAATYPTPSTRASIAPCSQTSCLESYVCQMGFRVANID